VEQASSLRFVSATSDRGDFLFSQAGSLLHDGTLMQPLLEVRGISKAFPGVQALADVAASIAPGEILAVVGENGAGKSTLMKILAGVYVPDVGEILWEGKPVKLTNVSDAEKLGIVLIHQELNLAADLDIAANVFLGREPTWGGPLRLIHPRIYAEAAALTSRLGLTASPRTRVSELPVGRQQLVEIARALSLKSRLLILDEPTSSLTDRETELLFKVLADLKRDGISIMYISHRLKEIEQIADRVVVLRDGKNAGGLERADIHHEKIVRLMVGRELKQFFQRNRTGDWSGKPPVIQVRDVRWSPRQKTGISFDIRPGEIVGMSGLIGAGRTELAETIFGVRPAVSGEIQIDGQPRRIFRPADAIASGVYLVPEDRRVEGLILTDSVKRNISLPLLSMVSRLKLISRRREKSLAQQMSDKMRVRTPSVEKEVGLLSGGNQQKVVLGKWLARSPRLLILDEPTRGIDVGAKSEIYALMDQLAGQGVAVLMISSDLEEILGMSDRVLVMHENRLAGEVTRSALSEEAIMRLATGGGGAA
jgi:ribose transport system ATP-binding protein